MKKYRMLVPIVLVVFMVASWYMLISKSMAVSSEYNKYLSEARRFAADGITKYAIENYNAALKIKKSPDIYREVADYYIEQGRDDDFLEWAKDYLTEYPTDPVAYEYLLSANLKQEDYKSCFTLLSTAQKRNIKSDKINDINEQIKWKFKIDFSSYENVGVYSNNFCAVQVKEKWGFVDRFGKLRVSTVYSETGAFTKSGYASVVNSKGEAYFIDKTGAKVLVSKDSYASFGLLVGEIVPAKNANNKFVYLNDKLEKISSEYDYASSFNNGIAVIKNGSVWQIIDTSFKVIADNYSDIKLDEKQIAYRNDRLFVSNGSEGYVLVDKNGKQICKTVFEDAMVFLGDAPAAVKIDGKWRFINKNGDCISDKTYDDARSFSNGIAAICIGGKWGFIDENENIIIEPQFNGAKDFNEKGSCFVMTNDKWQLLKLYRLNREE